MSILITGSTGSIGTQVLAHLEGQGVEIRALTRTPEKTALPAGITPVKGDLSDVDSMRAALKGTSTVFVLVPNVADELSQAMLTMNLAREAQVKGIVYLSVFKAEEYADVPHFASKHTVERMIQHLDVPATVLRSAYFIQNDLRQKDALLKYSMYGMPVGGKGVSMVDTRDIGAAAARELLRRHQATGALPRATYALVGPDRLDGPGLAQTWSDALNQPIRYGGDDLDTFEQRLKSAAPNWLAYDMRLMMRRYQEDGAVATAAELQQTNTVLGRAPRSYRSFAAEAAAQWTKG